MSNQHSATSPLDGLVVADFSRVLAGPLASMFLADMGATVIKVERPGAGDDTRAWGPPYVDGVSTYFTSVNRNKRSIALDLGNDDDVATARQLADRADVFIENFRPGRLAEFGLDVESLHASNPGLVYASISGFGAKGGAGLAGYDFVVQAAGGLMSITGTGQDQPMKVGVALVDVITGLHATVGILAALQERHVSGRGQHVEVNLLSSLLSSLVNQASGYINGAGVPRAMGNQHPSIAPYETLRTKDGPIAVAVGNDAQFAAMARAIGREDLQADGRFGSNSDRVINRDALVSELESALMAHSAQRWTEVLTRGSVPCSPVNDLAAAIDLAASLGLEPVVPVAGHAGPVSVMANPISFDRTPVRHRSAPPMLDADSDAVMAWLRGEIPALP